MKVFDLQCDAHGHLFEGWFASREDYDNQQARGLLTCPLCGADKVSRRLSAPRLNVSHLHRPPQPEAGAARRAPASMPPPDADATVHMAQLQAAVLRQVREMVRQSENVGPRFAEEARRIHSGDAEERPIRGTSTPEERAALAEEGIDFLALPDILDDSQLQ